MVAAIQINSNPEMDNGIGFNNDTLIRFGSDMKHYVEKTTFEPDHPVIMGSKTYFSVDEKYRPFKGRTNIVISRNTGLSLPAGVILASSPEAAYIAARKISKNVSIVGGGVIYDEFFKMGVINRLELTILETNFPADTYFPVAWKTFGSKVTTSNRFFEEKKQIHYRFETRDLL